MILFVICLVSPLRGELDAFVPDGANGESVANGGSWVAIDQQQVGKGSGCNPAPVSQPEALADLLVDGDPTTTISDTLSFAPSGTKASDSPRVTRQITNKIMLTKSLPKIIGNRIMIVCGRVAYTKGALAGTQIMIQEPVPEF